MWVSEVQEGFREVPRGPDDRNAVQGGEEVRNQKHVSLEGLPALVEDRVNVDRNRVAHDRDAEEHVEPRVSRLPDELLRFLDKPRGEAPAVGPLPDRPFHVQPEDEDQKRADGLARGDCERGPDQQGPALVNERLQEGDLDRSREDEGDQDRIPKCEEHVDPWRVVRVVQDLEEVDHGASASYPMVVIKTAAVNPFSGKEGEVRHLASVGRPDCPRAPPRSRSPADPRGVPQTCESRSGWVRSRPRGGVGSPRRSYNLCTR